MNKFSKNPWSRDWNHPITDLQGWKPHSFGAWKSVGPGNPDRLDLFLTSPGVGIADPKAETLELINLDIDSNRKDHGSFGGKYLGILVDFPTILALLMFVLGWLFFWVT